MRKIIEVRGGAPYGKSIHGWARQVQVRSSPSKRQVDDEVVTEGSRDATKKERDTVKARVSGEGRLLSRPKTKAVLVEASRRSKRALSSFMVLASLKEAAAIQGCEVADLIPPEELEQYR